MEIWKPVKDFEQRYWVNAKGQVRNQTKILKPHLDRYGYLAIGLFDGKGYLNKTVHRLVAEVFIPNPAAKPCIDHINTVKTDNRVENLRWCDHHENNSNPNGHIRRSEAAKKRMRECTYTEQDRQQFTRLMKKFWQTPRHRWTNGTEERLSVDCPGEGWRIGRSELTNEKISRKLKGRPIKRRNVVEDRKENGNE